MSLKSRFENAVAETSFYEKGIKPALQPWIDNWHDGDNGKYMSLKDSFANHLKIQLSPFRLAGGIAASTGSFLFNFAKGPAN